MAHEYVKQDEPNTSQEEVRPLPKERRITKSDWQKVETFLKEQLEERKRSDFRTQHERKWKEIDRQVAMNPMIKVNRDGSEVPVGWHNVIELGELSKASENLSADIVRIVFPQTRFWFDAHADIDDALDFDVTGQKKKNPKLQQGVNGRLRSFLSQQHADFGLKDRVKLSVKEALHHGGFVAEVVFDTQETIHDAVKVKSRSSATWVPHSLWNCYPDPSPSVVGTNMFYEGTMFIESYVPRYRAERMVKSGEDGWMPSQWRKVSKDEHEVKGKRTKDVKITTYWGDVNIPRTDGDLYYPNHKVMLMNGTMVYMAPNKTPYPPLIYKGYERLDVRDPYYISPIIKQSPMQKLGTVMANKGMDGTELWIEPPIVYDGNDPDFVLNGGPVIEPGAKVSTKGQNSFSQVKVGDPQIAFEALQWVVGEMKEKMGRPGKPVGDRATKAEVVKNAQDQEVSIVDFIDTLSDGLRSFLYMQHALNLKEMKEYTFYSPEMDDPDFIHIKRQDLPKAVHFEVVGARGVLGEEERTQKMSIVTAFAAGNQLFAPLLNTTDILLQMYQDAGVRNPERFLVEQGHEPPEMLRQKVQQLMQAVQKLGGMLQEEKQKSAVKMQKIQADYQAKMTKIQTDHKDRELKIHTDAMLEARKMAQDLRMEVAKLKQEITKDMMQFMAARQDAKAQPTQQ